MSPLRPSSLHAAVLAIAGGLLAGCGEPARGGCAFNNEGMLSFTRHEPGRACLGGGWDVRESLGVWTSGPAGALTVPRGRGDNALLIQGSVYWPAALRPQTVTVSVNGAVVEKLVYTPGMDKGQQRIVVPAALAGKGETFLLEFKPEVSASGQELGVSADPVRRGFYLRSLTRAP